MLRERRRSATIPGVADDTDPGITVYGTQWCGDCKRAKQFFGEQRAHYRFVDVDLDDAGLAFVEEASGGRRVNCRRTSGQAGEMAEHVTITCHEKVRFPALRSHLGGQCHHRRGHLVGLGQDRRLYPELRPLRQMPFTGRKRVRQWPSALTAK